MKVLIVSQHFYPESFRINDFAKSLVERGHQVSVLTGLPNYPKGKLYSGYSFTKGPYEESWEGVEIYRVPIVTRGRKKGLRLILNYLSFAFMGSGVGLAKIKEEHDVIFVFQTSPISMGVPALVLKLFYKTPVYFWTQDLWPDTLASVGVLKANGLSYKLIDRVVRIMYKNCDKILAPSQRITEKLKQFFPEEGRVVYFPNWAEDLFLQQVDVDEVNVELPEDIVKKEGIKFFFTGNLGIAQGLESILEAAEILRDEDDICFFLVGDGHLKDKVQNEVEERGLQRRVVLTGSYPLKMMPYFIAHADALLVSLKKDPLFEMTIPSKIQSYLASGKPIIAALDGEGAEIIEQKARCGFAAGSDKPEALAACVLRFKALSQEERNEMGARARQYYLEHFEKNKVINDFESMEIKLK